MQNKQIGTLNEGNNIIYTIQFVDDTPYWDFTIL